MKSGGVTTTTSTNIASIATLPEQDGKRQVEEDVGEGVIDMRGHVFHILSEDHHGSHPQPGGTQISKQQQEMR